MPKLAGSQLPEATALNPLAGALHFNPYAHRPDLAKISLTWFRFGNKLRGNRPVWNIAMTQRYVIDDLDREIIRYLTEDGRLSAAEIAGRIGSVSERTIRNRIAGLLQAQMIVIGAIPDPVALGREVQAELLIEVEPGRIEEVAIQIGEYDEIGYLAATTGSTSLSASLFVTDHAALLDFTENELGKLPGVKRVQSLVVLRLYKVFGTRTTAFNRGADRGGKKKG
jgi:Lrp/AsnC family transcriptional regulator for asnA, asnC and gidA